MAASLRHHLHCAPQSVAPGSLRTLLDAALATAFAELRHYALDDQGHILKHVEACSLSMNTAPHKQGPAARSVAGFDADLEAGLQ